MDNIKKFEGFLDRMQGLLDSARKQGHIIIRADDLENAFPELKESEDERIKETLIKFHKSTIDIDGIKGNEIVDWLEKQGKPKWSEEDERGSDETLELLEYFINYTPEFRRPAIRRSIDWIKSLKERMEEQQ